MRATKNGFLSDVFCDFSDYFPNGFTLLFSFLFLSLTGRSFTIFFLFIIELIPIYTPFDRVYIVKGPKTVDKHTKRRTKEKQ